MTVAMDEDVDDTGQDDDNDDDDDDGGDDASSTTSDEGDNRVLSRGRGQGIKKNPSLFLLTTFHCMIDGKLFFGMSINSNRGRASPATLLQGEVK